MARLFVALDVPRDLAGHLLRTLPVGRDVRPTPIAQLHLTLRFLGEQDETAAARIALALRDVRMAPMRLQPSGVGRFHGRQGDILWAGLADATPLADLVSSIDARLEGEGIARERRRFRPHLTLARCRPGVPEPLLRDWLARYGALALAPWEVDRFQLFESFLSADGARHVVRETYAVNPGC